MSFILKSFPVILVCVAIVFANGDVYAASGKEKNKRSHLTIDVAADTVGISTNFSGADVVAFGTVDATLRGSDIAVTLSGPDVRSVVREKMSVGGMWLNRSSVEFDHIPHFYAYAVDHDENMIADKAVMDKYGIGLDALNFIPADEDDKELARTYQEALIRLWQSKGFYPLKAQQVLWVGEGLFRINFHLPSTISTGLYTIRVYAFKNGRVSESADKIFVVEQVGMAADVRHFALHHSFPYAAIMLIMAISIGMLSAGLSRRHS